MPHNRREDAGVGFTYVVQQTAGYPAAGSVFGVGVLEHYAAVDGKGRRGGGEEQRQYEQCLIHGTDTSCVPVSRHKS